MAYGAGIYRREDGCKSCRGPDVGKHCSLCFRVVSASENHPGDVTTTFPTNTRWTCYGKMLCESLVRRTLSRQTVVPSSSNNEYSLAPRGCRRRPCLRFSTLAETPSRPKPGRAYLPTHLGPTGFVVNHKQTTTPLRVPPAIAWPPTPISVRPAHQTTSCAACMTAS